MAEVRQSSTFKEWFGGLSDVTATAAILARIRRLELNNPGDVDWVGGKVSELRIDHGPGYRLYFTRRGVTLYLLLCAGTKKTQGADIKNAKQMVMDLDAAEKTAKKVAKRPSAKKR